MPQHMIVVGFTGTRRASEVLAELRKLEDKWVVDLEDAVAAYRTDDGRLRIEQSVMATRGQGADWGVLLGGLLGALIAAPFTAAGADDATDWKNRYGISDEFVEGVGRLIKPGSSAVFALIESGNPDLVIERFRGYGGKILTTSLSPREAARVERSLRGLGSDSGL